jgi:hypothetical protein
MYYSIALNRNSVNQKSANQEITVSAYTAQVQKEFGKKPIEKETRRYTREESKVDMNIGIIK